MNQSKEVPLQLDMFSGALVDTRTRTQKQHDTKAEQPQPIEMFSQRDIAQFGVQARPLMPIASGTKLALISEDPRTPDEVERDTQRAAEEKTYRMFSEEAVPPVEDLGEYEYVLFHRAKSLYLP